MTALAAPLATEAQVRACTNAVIFELNGIPRSAIAATAGSLEADGTALVNWSTRNGGSGFCWVAQDNKVVQVSVEVSDNISQVPTPLRSSTASGAAPGTEMQVATEGGALNIRSGPGGEITGSVADGSTLVLTGQTSGEWVEVEGGGWVSQYHLAAVGQSTSTSEAAESAPTDSNPIAAGPVNLSSTQARVATGGDGINVRSAPGGEVIFSLPDGSTVNLTGRNENGWVELQEGGWVSEVYLQYGSE